MFGWFDAQDAARFAKSIVHDISTVFPPGQPPRPTQKERDKVSKALDAAFQRAADYSRENKLNLYKKAKYLNTLRWGLAELKYPTDFVEDVVKDVLMRMGK